MTLALGMGGCYAEHRDTPGTDAGEPEDSAIVRADAGPPPDVDCVPDPDCNPYADGPPGDGTCDWDQYNGCCTVLEWSIEACWLPGGPLSPPEMPA